ncbi:MAG: choice-of-anchor B family protein [Gemmatimonadota bacterium]
MRILSLFLTTGLLVGLGAQDAEAQNLRFGASMIAGDGEVIVGEVSNNLRPGTVYVYHEAGGTWSEAAQLRAPDAEVHDSFGAPLARSGSTLFVGQAGEVHLFEREADGSYRAAGTLPLPELEEGEQFGAAFAAEGDRLLVGAPVRGGGGWGGGGNQAAEIPGAVYVFERNAEGEWAHQGKLSALDGEAQDAFGHSIAIDGPQVIIGAPGASEGAGAAHVFELDAATGEWNESARLFDGQSEAGDAFGSSVALDGQLAVIGVPQYANGHGAAYAYRQQTEGGDAWAQHARLLPFVGSPQDRFGTNVAISGSEIWVGAPSTGQNIGTAYLFTTEGDQHTIASARAWGIEETTRGDRFGNRLTAADGVALVAATGKDHGMGSVALYHRNPTGAWSETALLEPPADALDRIVGEEVDCQDEDGSIGPFECTGPVSLLSFLPVLDLTLPGEGRGTRLNDIWGWHDEETGREYAIVGRIDGTSFVDVTDPRNPVLIGVLPTTPGGPPSATWRDPKVYQDHAFIVADAAGAHGMQVFDLRQLRDFEGEPREYEPTALYTEINSAHNVVINEETGFAYVVGASAGGTTCGGGLHMVNVQDPPNPQFAGCFAHEGTGRAGGGYTHDAQCVVYRGPDERYHGHEICFGGNEQQLSIADVTDKSNPVALSVGEYPNPGYLHQGWLTEDHQYYFMNDELDLLNESVETTRTLVFDISDLEDPLLHLEFMGSFDASAHNLYIRDDLMYQSNYRYGLHVIDISDPSNPEEVGHLDTTPYLSGAGFSGSWGNYPYFESGAVAVTSGSEGLFMVRYRDPSVVFEEE